MAVLSRLANLVMRQISTPQAPPAGSVVLYPKTDGRLYTYDSDGGEARYVPVKVARVATTGAITLSGTQTVDGVALAAGDRVLVRNQGVYAGNSYDNGIWVVAAGAWSRAVDANTASKLALSRVYVTEGANFAGTTFETTFRSTDTLGTTAVGFASTRIETGTIFDQPLNGGHGQAFYNDVNRYLSIWDGSAWSSPKGIQEYGATAPQYPKTGELWADSAAQRLKLWTGSTWQIVGYLDDDPDWIAPSLVNSWANYPGFEEAGYLKRSGVVYLKGLVRNGTVGSTIFTLPVGYRPLAANLFLGTGSGSSGAASAGTAHTHPLNDWGRRININSDGTVTAHAGATNGYISLSGISFPLTP